MSDKYTFAILGGDRRQAVIAKKIRALGHTVRVYGISAFVNEMTGAEICSTAEKAINGSDIILLPLPTSRDGKTLNLCEAEQNGTIELENIINHAHKNGNSLIIGGVIPEQMIKNADEYGIEIIDFYQKESLQRLNALPSAEGAISLAMQNSDKVIEGTCVLVAGYGRIGKLLAQKLRALGANVTVAARRDEVLCDISMSGYNAVRTTDTKMLQKALLENEIVFNTVPDIIFTRAVIVQCTTSPIYIEIASAPGGIDVSYARERGIKIYFAPSLPGKYAPVSAGEYIFETITDILRERGVEI